MPLLFPLNLLDTVALYALGAVVFVVGPSVLLVLGLGHMYKIRQEVCGFYSRGGGSCLQRIDKMCCAAGK